MVRVRVAKLEHAPPDEYAPTARAWILSPQAGDAEDHRGRSPSRWQLSVFADGGPVGPASHKRAANHGWLMVHLSGHAICCLTDFNVHFFPTGAATAAFLRIMSRNIELPVALLPPRAGARIQRFAPPGQPERFQVWYPYSPGDLRESTSSRGDENSLDECLAWAWEWHAIWQRLHGTGAWHNCLRNCDVWRLSA